MSKNKKNLGKIKRYNRVFYTRKQMARTLGGWAAAILLLFAVGYLVGPAVIDFGTHTWYTKVKGLDLDSASGPASSPASEAQPTPDPQPTPAPTPEPTPEPPLTEGDWAFASLGSFGSPEAIAAAAQSYADQGFRYVVVPIKDASGYLFYNSALPDASASVAAKTIDAAAVAAALAEKGIIPVASVCAFQDPIAVYTNRDMGIHYQTSDYMWLDNTKEAGGKPWMDPFSPASESYISGILDEVCAMGYRAVLLSGVQFPARHDANCGYSGGQTPGAARLAELIAGWSTALQERDAVLWVQYPLAAVASAEPVKELAGTVEQLGIEHLLISMPAEPAEEDSLLAAALERAGGSRVVVKRGDTASFQ